MKFHRLAKSPGACAWRLCERPGNMVFKGEAYWYRACCRAHAEHAERQLNTLTPATRRVLWGEHAH